jgi:hypothetical protein
MSGPEDRSFRLVEVFVTVYRATIPFLIVGLNAGIVMLEMLNPEQDWGRVAERLLCVWGGIAVFAAPLFLERWEDQRQARHRHRTRRRRRSRSSEEGADAQNDGRVSA